MSTQDRKLTIKLTPGPARFARGLANKMGCNIPETVRRALTVLAMVVGLTHEEELLIRNTRTGAIERIRFEWTGTK